MPPMMNRPGPAIHPSYPSPSFQSQQTSHSGEQHIPSTLPNYVNLTLPSTSNNQDHVVNYNHEQTIPGMARVDDSYRLTIPPELLEQHTTFARLPRPRTGLKEVIFLGPTPHPDSMSFFLHSRDMLISRAIHYLERVPYLEKITFSLDYVDLTRILQTLTTIHGMREIELTLPAFDFDRYSMDMVQMQHAFIIGLKAFTNLERLTIPMEFVTTLLLSYLAILPELESLTVKYTPPPRSPHHHHQRQQFPAWSSDTIPAECPGYVFLAHLKFDPRGYFRKLESLNLSAPGLSDVSYTTLRTLFPNTYICWNEGTTLRN